MSELQIQEWMTKLTITSSWLRLKVHRCNKTSHHNSVKTLKIEKCNDRLVCARSSITRCRLRSRCVRVTDCFRIAKLSLQQTKKLYTPQFKSIQLKLKKLSTRTITSCSRKEQRVTCNHSYCQHSLKACKSMKTCINKGCDQKIPEHTFEFLLLSDNKIKYLTH